MKLFKALVRDVVLAVNERVSELERENEKLRTALEGSQREANAAWEALENFKSPP